MATTRRTFVRSAALAAAAAGAGDAWPALNPGSPTGAKAAAGRMLILGGTGFLGPAVVEEALGMGWRLTLFNRGRTNPHLFPEVARLIGDREQGLEAVEAEVARGCRWEVVVDTTAYVPGHVEASARLVAPFARHYVLLSSIGAYADHSQPVDESSPVAEVDDAFVAATTTILESLTHYGAMKARCERAAEFAMPGRVTVIRPGLLVGPRDRSDRFTYWAVRVARGGEVLAPGDGRDPVQFVDARDLARWILRVVEDGTFGTFNAASPAGLFTVAELLHGLKAAVWTDARFTWIPREVLAELELEPWTDLPVWVPAEGETAAFHLASTAKALGAGLAFRPLADSARDTVAWFTEERGLDADFGERAGLPRQREEAALAAWHSHQGRSSAAPAAAVRDPGRHSRDSVQMKIFSGLRPDRRT